MDTSIRMMVMCSALSLACGPEVTGQDESGTAGSADDTTANVTTPDNTTANNTTADNSTADNTTMTTDPSGPVSNSASASDSESTSVSESTGNEPSCKNDGGGPGAEGTACTSNDQCSSGVCVRFSDAPVDPDAACGGANPGDETGCTTRFTATVLDIATREPVDGADVRVAAALNALTDPVGAHAVASGSAGDDGRVDFTSDAPISAAIAIIALVETPTAFLTAIPVAAPISGASYGTANEVHDLWLVPSDRLAAWSAALADDPEIPGPLLPLGIAGGVVGLVRDADGVPISGAVVSPTDAGSNAIIRYVHADDAIDADATDGSGLFIVLGAQQVGEDFEATLGGDSIATGSTSGANSVVFTLILTAP